MPSKRCHCFLFFLSRVKINEKEKVNSIISINTRGSNDFIQNWNKYSSLINSLHESEPLKEKCEKISGKCPHGVLLVSYTPLFEHIQNMYHKSVTTTVWKMSIDHPIYKSLYETNYGYFFPLWQWVKFGIRVIWWYSFFLSFWIIWQSDICTYNKHILGNLGRWKVFYGLIKGE